MGIKRVAAVVIVERWCQKARRQLEPEAFPRCTPNCRAMMALPRDEPHPSMEGMRRRRLRARKRVGNLGGLFDGVVDAGRARLQLL